MNERHNEFEPEAAECYKMLDYMDQQIRAGMDGPNGTDEEQAALDAAADVFYGIKATISFGDKIIHLENSAAVFNALQDALKFIIDQQ